MRRRIGIDFSWAFLACMELMLAGCASQGTLDSFKSDGCTLFPDRSRKADWCQCCLIHDMAYWQGGTAEDRHIADAALKDCVASTSGNKALANLMFAGVRVAGGPRLPTSFRWGYGWPFPKPYGSLTPGEQAQASKLKQEYLSGNPSLICPR